VFATVIAVTEAAAIDANAGPAIYRWRNKAKRRCEIRKRQHQGDDRGRDELPQH
jgi:hypothetical protein